MRARRRGHDAAALLDQQQCRLPRDRTRGRKRCDLAEAVTGRHADVLQAIALAPDLVGGPANGHAERLDHIGPGELLDRPLEAQLSDGHLEHLFRALEDAPRRRVAVIEVLAHARLLHSLAWEEKRDWTGESYTHVISVRPTSSGLRPR